MKKIVVLLLTLMLVGCNEKKIIEVEHRNDFTSELIGEIQLYNEDSYVSVNNCDFNALCIHELNEDIDKNYEFNLETYEMKEYNTYDESDDSVSFQFKNIVFDNGFKIYLESTHIDNSIIRKFYYEKDGIETLLIERESNRLNSENGVFDFTYNSDSEHYYFFIREEDECVTYQVEDAMLKEIDRVPVFEKGFELMDIYTSIDGICYDYSNEETLRYVMNGKELIIPKNENDKVLIDYLIDGLSPKRLVYKENGMITLHLEDEVYELGYNASYQIRDNYILSTTWKEDFSEKETYLIDRNTKKTYQLSECFEFYHSFFLDRNLYLSYNYNNEVPYTIYQVDGLNVTAISLPFNKDFEFIHLIDEHTMIFQYQNKGILQLYKLKF